MQCIQTSSYKEHEDTHHFLALPYANSAPEVPIEVAGECRGLVPEEWGQIYFLRR